MKFKKLLIFGLFVTAVLSALYFFMLTSSGSKIVADSMIAQLIPHEDLDYKSLEGNLKEGLIFNGLVLKNVGNLPEGTVIKIQRLLIDMRSMNLNGIYVEIENARILWPDSDALVISGKFEEQQLELNIYSNGFRVTDILNYMPDLRSLYPIKGDLAAIDLHINGHYLDPSIKGDFVIGKFIYKGFVLTGTQVQVDLQVKNITKEVEFYGDVRMTGGELSTKRVLVKLDMGHFNYSGIWDQPAIHLIGSSKVEKTKINITLKGTVEKPDLILKSEPPYSRQKLMVMLATGKSWKSVEDSLDTGLNSAALTKDFIDYFFFAGKSNQFAKKFGISDFSVTFDRDRQGVAAKKEVTEKLEVGYGIEQMKTDGQVTDVSQKLGGAYKLTDKLSVGVEREIKKTQTNGTFDDRVGENNDKIMIEYKKKF